MVRSNIVIEGARIGFRNFSGVEGKFNPAGRRNFCVFLDYDLGEELEKDGWNVRWLQPRDEEEDRQPYLQVTVSYDNIPPKIVLVTSKNKTVLRAPTSDVLAQLSQGIYFADPKATEDTLMCLDYAEIKNVDLTIRPYNWTVNGKSGVKAYIKSLWVTIVEDDFEDKYYDVPDSATNTASESLHGD